MPHDTAAACSVLLIEARIVRAAPLKASVAAQDALHLVGCVSNLNQAYGISERDQPDIVVVSGDLARTADFPMFAKLLKSMGLTCVVLTAGSQMFAEGAVSLNVSEMAEAGGLGAWIVQQRGLAPVKTLPHPKILCATKPKECAPGAWRTVVIGASTGGVEALLEVLSHYASDCPPTLIVQHIGPAFLPGLVTRLNCNCAAEVCAAEQGMRLRPGRVILASGNVAHLTLDSGGDRCRITKGQPISGHMPSADALFLSAAALGEGCVGVVLTGMGRDGAEGLAAIRHAGGWTIGQDAESAVVYGMPRAAAILGAVVQELPLGQIGPAILKAAARRRAEVRNVAHG